METQLHHDDDQKVLEISPECSVGALEVREGILHDDDDEKALEIPPRRIVGALELRGGILTQLKI